MSVDTGYLVKTKTGKDGRTYHKDGLINEKMIVHTKVDGEIVKMLCDPDTVEITGYVD